MQSSYSDRCGRVCWQVNAAANILRVRVAEDEADFSSVRKPAKCI